MATTTIYLSSTYEDLKDYRRAVVETLRQSGCHVIGMEDYVATPHQRPVDECLKDVEKADIYVGLFAFRYGYVPPSHHKNPDGLSITELEFRHAETLKKPCLTFIAKRDAGIPLDLVDAYTGDGDKGKRIERLRQDLLTEKLASEFSHPHKLAALVLAAVTKHLDGKKISALPDATEQNGPAAITWDIDKNGSPYPGLLHFTRKYAPVFFGREAEVREILDRMRLSEGRFLLVSGNSGVGKSSVVAAGVLPLIEKTPLPGSTSCLCVRMVPSKGPHPFNALMGALHPYATAVGLNPESMEKDLIQSPLRLAHYVHEILSKGIDHDALVLFLDQMEELFTAQDLEASKAFLTALYHAAQEGALWVLATIRSDHLHHCHGHPDMLRLLRGKGHYPVGPIEPFMLSDLIAKPARCAGLSINDNLVRRIAHETVAKADDAKRSDQSNLPLLAFVLDELFKKRSNHDLSEAVYEQLGGIKGAIAHHAATVESTIREKRGAATAALLPKLFQSLVIVNAEGLPTRRRPLSSAFSSEMNEVIPVLVRERLLHTEGKGKSATVSISHEALFEAWPSLQTYVATNGKQLMDQRLLESRARKWVNMGKPWFGGLASGREYRDFCRTGVTPTQEMKDYLRASRRARWIQAAIIGAFILLLGGPVAWMGKEGVTVQYAGSIVLARLHLVRVPEPDKESMIKIPSGTYQPGDRSDKSEHSVRKVTIKPFAMGKYEVTFEEYDRYVELIGSKRPDDSRWGRERRPVINVSWDDAKAYAKWLSQATGKSYRLPTESEWEYAARSGGQDEIWAGTSNKDELKDYAVFQADRTEPVGRKKPNSLGLYDMSGNVWEWVRDCYDNVDEDKCSRRVLRGGSWGNEPEDLRASYRGWNHADDRFLNIGFRLVQDIDQ